MLNLDVDFFNFFRDTMTCFVREENGGFPHSKLGYTTSELRTNGRESLWTLRIYLANLKDKFPALQSIPEILPSSTGFEMLHERGRMAAEYEVDEVIPHWGRRKAEKIKNMITHLPQFTHSKTSTRVAMAMMLAYPIRAVGVEKDLLKPGTGPKPVSGQNVTVHCTGFGKNGDLTKKFWSTKDPGQKPFSFQIGQGSVIKGWDEGVLGMEVGEVARLRCTPDYAYGPNGFPAWGIQPDLVFEIQVLSVD